jgi:hypothetical protein
MTLTCFFISICTGELILQRGHWPQPAWIPVVSAEQVATPQKGGEGVGLWLSLLWLTGSAVGYERSQPLCVHIHHCSEEGSNQRPKDRYAAKKLNFRSQVVWGYWFPGASRKPNAPGRSGHLRTCCVIFPELELSRLTFLECSVSMFVLLHFISLLFIVVIIIINIILNQVFSIPSWPHTLYSQGWPQTSDCPASSSWVPGLQLCIHPDDGFEFKISCIWGKHSYNRATYLELHLLIFNGGRKTCRDPSEAFLISVLWILTN